MATKMLGRHGFLALALTLGGAMGCGDGDADADVDGADPGSTGAEGERGTGGGGAGSSGGQQAATQDIVETAASAGAFTVLAGALFKAGLVDALKGDGPFTVFAPTDDAFAKLPASTLDSLSKEALAAILSYHVVSGAVPSTAVKAGAVKMLSGLSAFLGTEGGVTINGASVTTPDVAATNGVIHVIDTVILPPNLVEAAQLAGGFSTLISAVGTAGLGGALSDPAASLTVFAPTDMAFAALPEGTLKALTKEQLTGILTYHVVAGQVLSTGLMSGEVETLNGAKVTVDLSDGVKIDEASVVLADIVTSNGVIHVIDKVLLP